MERFLGTYSDYLYALMRIIVGYCLPVREPESSLVSLAEWEGRGKRLPYFHKWGWQASSNFWWAPRLSGAPYRLCSVYC
jgi:hypothetical protein